MREMLGVACLPQQGQELGQRMLLAFARIFSRGYEGCLLMGSDIPMVSGGDIETAWRALHDNDVVLGASDDGGYWLVGSKKLFPPLFKRQTYGHGEVLARTLEVCAANGLSVGLASAKRDIDTWEDLQYFSSIVKQDKSPHLFRFTQKLFGKES